MESNFKLNCLVLGDDPSRIFEIKIAPTESVGALRNVIKKERIPQFDHAPADHLKLWEVNLPVDDALEHNLRFDIEHKAPLSPVVDMLEVFVKLPQRNHLHIVVQGSPTDIPYPDAQQAPLNKRTELSPDPRDAYLNESIGRPSSAAIPSNFARTQENKEKQYLCSRPRKVADPVPVILLQRVFAEFLDDCENYRPTADDNAFVWQLSYNMSSFYPSEDHRMVAFRQLLSGYGIPTVDSSQYGTGGYMMSSQGYALLIIEGKNEIGDDSADPFLQALASYRTLLEEGRKFNPVPRPQSIFPCFNIVVFGPCFGICGSIFPAKIQSDVLGPIIPLFCHQTNLLMQAMAVRTLGSLKIAINKLKILYDTPLLSFNPGDDFILQCPYPRSYTDSAGNTHEFSYEKMQTLRNQLIFFGTVNDEARSKICIKFVRRYSPEVHRFCANREHAPKLIAYEPLPGGWNMVVMDVLPIDSHPSSRRSGSYRQLSKMAFQDRQPLEGPITSLIHELHEGGYVHGDLRDINLFAGLDGKFMLLDFDWAGPITKTIYPMHVNRYGVDRPDGAKAGMEITVDHDLDMLTPIFHGIAAKDRHILSRAEESLLVEESPMDM